MLSYGGDFVYGMVPHKWTGTTSLCNKNKQTVFTERIFHTRIKQKMPPQINLKIYISLV